MRSVVRFGPATSTFIGFTMAKRRPRWFSLVMVRGKRSVFIGLFPNLYRAENCACRLEWDADWKPSIAPVHVEVQGELGMRDPAALAHPWALTV